MPLCVPERWTSYVYKDSNGDESNFSTQGNKIVDVTSAAETKQLKRSLAWIKINNKRSKRLGQKS